MPKPKFADILYISSWIIVAMLFMAANRIDIKRYTPYQMLVWEIKANEGYRSWWYPDGKTKTGKQKHSIGFGWNDLGGSRRHEIAKYTSDRKVTYDEALKITIAEIGKWGRFHSDPYRNLAMQLYSYNCGRISSPKQLGKCHQGSNVKGKRCGHWNPDVRIAHNRRREYELALWRHDWRLIQQYTEQNRDRVQYCVSKLKRGGAL